MAKLVWVTPAAEIVMGWCARVSSPQNRENPPDKLLAYCIKNKHWSVFEMASMCVEINTSRAISQQIVRHRSFSFQEMSQRYVGVQECLVYGARRQAAKNRQSSTDDLPGDTVAWFNEAQANVISWARRLYDEALEKGIAKESARFLLPMSSVTRLCMNGTIRSWIHYLELRTDEHTQKEHRDIAEKIKEIFIKELPVTSAALGWVK